MELEKKDGGHKDGRETHREVGEMKKLLMRLLEILRLRKSEKRIVKERLRNLGKKWNRGDDNE